MKSEGEETLALHFRAEKIDFQREQVVNPDRKFRWDFVLERHKYVIDIQGGIWNQGGHVRGKRYEADCEKGNCAVRDGYLPLHFTTNQVKSGHAIDFIKKLMN